MDFDLTEEQEELCSSVRDVLARECPIAVVRERVEKGISPAQPVGFAVIFRPSHRICP